MGHGTAIRYTKLPGDYRYVTTLAKLWMCALVCFTMPSLTRNSEDALRDVMGTDAPPGTRRHAGRITSNYHTQVTAPLRDLAVPLTLLPPQTPLLYGHFSFSGITCMTLVSSHIVVVAGASVWNIRTGRGLFTAFGKSRRGTRQGGRRLPGKPSSSRYRAQGNAMVDRNARCDAHYDPPPSNPSSEVNRRAAGIAGL